MHTFTYIYIHMHTYAYTYIRMCAWPADQGCLLEGWKINDGRCDCPKSCADEDSCVGKSDHAIGDLPPNYDTISEGNHDKS